MVGTSLGSELFSDLDFVDDVALLAEMLSLQVLALEIMDKEARSLGLTINWSKTKIQTMLDPAPAGNQVTIWSQCGSSGIVSLPRLSDPL